MPKRKYRFTRNEILNEWDGAKEPCVLRWLGKIQKRRMKAYLLFFCFVIGWVPAWEGGGLSPHSLLDLKKDRNSIA